MNKHQAFPSHHKDFINDIAFDHYGRRIATCSADRTVKIFDLDENGDWIKQSDLKNAHGSGVTSVSWAHPEYGQLMATSGANGEFKIWEERPDSGTGGLRRADSGIRASSSGGSNSSLSGNSGKGTLWSELASVKDTSKPLKCVKIAPRHLGLKLATASADGCVRIYEAVDMTNLGGWALIYNIKPEKVDVGVVGVTCLDWCQGRFEAPTLVAGDSAGNIKIYRENKGLWHELDLSLDGHVHPRKGVLHVSWSPDVGRSYHLISSCGRDGLLKVHKLKKSFSESGSREVEKESCKILKTQDEVWRCSWNVTGTVLASSGDGGKVALWKSDLKGNWKCVSEV